jgi:hypothetical protein
MQGWISPYSFQHLLLSIILVLARSGLEVVSCIYISVMTRGMVHHCICLLAVFYITFVEMPIQIICPFLSQETLNLYTYVPSPVLDRQYVMNGFCQMDR